MNSSGEDFCIYALIVKYSKYIARFTDRDGKRIKKEFIKLQECKKWLSEAIYSRDHDDGLFSREPTVDAWYDYWINHVKKENIRSGTKNFYDARYRLSIKPVIGEMLLKDVKPVHCQNLLNRMSDKYSKNVIANTRMVLYMIFSSAEENELILKNPVKRSVKCNGGNKAKIRKSLTIDEQKTFLYIIKDCSCYNQYAFVLQTGVRA